MAIVRGYRKKDWRVACAICGAKVWFSDTVYIGQNRWACDQDAPGWTAEAEARHNARVRPLLIKPRAVIRPLSHVGVYQAEEAMIFNLVISQALLRSSVSSSGAGAVVVSAQRMGAAAVYLSEIITEGQRPTGWINLAVPALRALADALLALQYGTPAGPSPTEPQASVLYGGFGDAGAFTPVGQNYAGLALLRAYAQFGDDKYLAGANACAWFLRALQRRDAVVLSPTPTYVGGFVDSLTLTRAAVTTFSVSGCLALWFLSELRALVGGGTMYGIAAPGSDFALATAGTLDSMLSDARAFYAGGRLSGWSIAPTSGTFGPLAPLSAVTPRNAYDSATGLFTLGTVSTFPESVNGLLFGEGLRGLYEYEGYSATVAGIYEWLMSFQSNPSAEFTS